MMTILRYVRQAALQNIHIAVWLLRGNRHTVHLAQRMRASNS